MMPQSVRNANKDSYWLGKGEIYGIYVRTVDNDLHWYDRISLLSKTLQIHENMPKVNNVIIQTMARIGEGLVILKNWYHNHALNLVVLWRSTQETNQINESYIVNEFLDGA